MLVFYAQVCGPEAHYQNSTPKVLKSYAFALPHFLHQPDISLSDYRSELATPQACTCIVSIYMPVPEPNCRGPRSYTRLELRYLSF